MWRLVPLVLIFTCFLMMAPLAPADAPDFDTSIPPGHWFTQTNGASGPRAIGDGRTL